MRTGIVRKIRTKILLLDGLSKALLCLTLAVSIVASIYFVKYLFKPNTGLVVYFPEVVFREGRVLFAPKTPFSPAVASGLIPYRDVIVSVNGAPIKNTRDIVSADSEVRSFEPILVEVLRDNREQLFFEIDPVLNLYRPDWFFMLVFSAVLIFTAFYLALRSAKYHSYAFLALACLTYLVFTCVKPFYYTNALTNSLIHFGKMTVWLIVIFGMYFPTKRWNRPIRTLFLCLVSVLFLAFLVMRIRLFALWSATSVETYLIQFRWLGKINNVSEGIAYLIYLGLLGTAYAKTPLLDVKRQIEWIIAGFMVALPPYFFFDQLPFILDNQPGFRLSLGSFANIFLSIFPLFIVIGLIKKRVINFMYFLSRYVVYLILALLVILFFSTLFIPFVGWMQNNYGVNYRIAGFLVFLFLFVFLFPLRSVLARLSERIFYRVYYRNTVAHLSHLKRQNRELYLLVEELNRQMTSSYQREKYRDIKGIVKGMIERLRGPTRTIGQGLIGVDRNLTKIDPYLAKIAGLENGREIVRSLKEDFEAVSVGNRDLKDFLNHIEVLTGLSSSGPASANATLLVRSAISRFKTHFPEIKVVYDSPGNPTVRVNAQDLIETLEHLYRNAAEAESSIEIHTTCTESDGYCAIEVGDTGPGIPRVNQKRIYYPFFTTKRGHEGLGLYICKTAIERNSGSIELLNDRDGGAHFKIMLPLDAE